MPLDQQAHEIKEALNTGRIISMTCTCKAGKHSAGDRRVAERDPQRGDRGIPGDPPRSL